MEGVFSSQCPQAFSNIFRPAVSALTPQGSSSAPVHLPHLVGAAFCGPFPLVSELFDGRNGVPVARAIRMARQTVGAWWMLVVWFCALVTLKLCQL